MNKQHQSLPLVCEVFRAVFLTCPELSADLLLKPTQALTAVMSLLEHLRRDGLRIIRSVQYLGIDQVSTSHSPMNVLSLEASLHLLPMLRHVMFYPKLLRVDCRVI